MLDKILRSGKNSLIYAIGNVSRKAIAFLLLPLYVKQLSISDYGILGIMEVSSQALIAIFGFGLHMALNRWYWDTNYQDKQKEITFTVTVFLLGTSIIIYSALAPFSSLISNVFFGTSQYAYLMRLVLVVSLLEIITQVFFSIMRLEEKSILFSWSNIIRLVFTILVTIYLIVFKDHGIAGIYEAQLAGVVIYFILILRFIIDHIRIHFERVILHEMLVYCFPLILSSISGIILTLTDRYVLNFMSELDQVAIYNLAAKFAYVIMVFVVKPIRMSLTPILYKMIDEPDCKRFYSKVLTYFSYIILICVMFVSFFGREIIIFFIGNKTQYWPAAGIIPIIALMIFFGMMKDTAVLGMNIKKKTKTISIIMLIAAIINLIANLILIPYWHAYGAAAATLFSQIILFILTFTYSQKFYSIPYEIGKIIKMISSALILYLISINLPLFSIPVNIIIKLLLIVAFPFILLLLNFYEDIEIYTIKRLLRIKQ